LIKIIKISPKTLLPLFFNMLNLSGNVNILGLLSILEIYYDDLDEVMAESII